MSRRGGSTGAVQPSLPLLWPAPRTPLLRLLGVLFSMCTLPHAVSAQSTAARDERAIRAELDSTAAGWNRGDLARYLAAYVDTATTMGAAGPVIGKANIEKQMRGGFWKAGRPAQLLHYESVVVRFLGANYALTTGQYVLTGNGAPNRTGWFTTIWARVGGVWRMVHDHS